MELKPGYKHTELGLLPEDWELLSVDDAIRVNRGGSPRPIQAYLTTSDSGVNWIKIGDTQRGGKYIDSTAEKIRVEGVNKSREVFSGQLLLSNSMSFGRPYILRLDGCIHDGWLVLQEFEKSFCTEYLYYALGSNVTLSQYKTLAAGSGVQNLNKEVVGKVQVVCPPLEEQEAIAEVLGDVDAQIRALKRQVSKKRGLLRGVVQNAFAREKVPQHSVFENLVEFSSETQSVAEVNTDSFCIELENMASGGGLIGSSEKVNLKGLRRVFRHNDVLFSKLRPYLNKFWLADRDGLVSTEVWVLRPKSSNLLPGYLAAYVASDLFLAVAGICEGTKMPRSDRSVMAAHMMPFHSIEEQEKIALCYADLCRELNRINAGLFKLEERKKAVVQALLTGKIRLA